MSDKQRWSAQVGLFAAFLSIFMAFDWYLNERLRVAMRTTVDEIVEEHYEDTWGVSAARHERTHEMLQVLLRELRKAGTLPK